MVRDFENFSNRGWCYCRRLAIDSVGHRVVANACWTCSVVAIGVVVVVEAVVVGGLVWAERFFRCDLFHLNCHCLKKGYLDCCEAAEHAAAAVVVG